MALESGTTIGSYEVTAQIGQGGMGEVYRARDTGPDCLDRPSGRVLTIAQGVFRSKPRDFPSCG